MNSNDKDIALIRKYFDLALSEEELSSIEDRIQSDPVFASKIEAYQQSIHIVNQKYKDRSLERRTETWRNLIKGQDTSSKSFGKWQWAASIAAGFLILISVWYFNDSNDVDYNTLAKKAWSKKVGFDYYKVRNNDTARKNIFKAYQEYENKNYTSAINALQHYTSSSIHYEDALFIRALAKYKIGDTDIALQKLDTLSNNPSGKMAKEALWYQGLIYLDQNDLESAQKFLEIPKDDASEIKLKE